MRSRPTLFLPPYVKTSCVFEKPWTTRRHACASTNGDEDMHGASTSSDASSSNAFKAAFKAYRLSNEQRARIGCEPLLEFGEGHSLGDAAMNATGVVEAVPVAANAASWLKSARIFSVRGYDGFRFIRCPFSSAEAQLELAHSVLSDWIEPPAANNLSTAAGVSQEESDPQSQFWAQHVKASIADGKLTSAASTTASAKSVRASTGVTSSTSNSTTLLSRLAWATVGYQYQWTERQYDPSKRCPMPPDLTQLAIDLAGACGWSLRPEAAILNLYGVKSTMGGHLDDAEPCQSAPIVSISLGLEAIYLLGGRTKADPAIAMLLRSGDVVVQGGCSRGFVHGVPRVLGGTLSQDVRRIGEQERAQGSKKGDLAAVAQWLSDHRLNINVRQVFEDDHDDRSLRPAEKEDELEPVVEAEALHAAGQASILEHVHGSKKLPQKRPRGDD